MLTAKTQHNLPNVREYFEEHLCVADGLGTFGPSVAVGMQRNAFDAKPFAPLLEFRGTIATADGLQIRKQWTLRRQPAQHGFDVRAKMNHGQTAGFLPRIGDGLVGPVNVLRLEIGDVGLRTAEMPAQFVETAPLRVFLPPDDELMFITGDATFVLEAHFRPEALGNERPRQPVHRDAKVMEFPQVNIRADRTRLEAGEQMLGLGFQNHARRILPLALSPSNQIKVAVIEP